MILLDWLTVELWSECTLATVDNEQIYQTWRFWQELVRARLHHYMYDSLPYQFVSQGSWGLWEGRWFLVARLLASAHWLSRKYLLLLWLAPHSRLLCKWTGQHKYQEMRARLLARSLAKQCRILPLHSPVFGCISLKLRGRLKVSVAHKSNGWSLNNTLTGQHSSFLSRV